MEQRFRVEWRIDLYAETAREAAEQAFSIMQRDGTFATYFEVYDQDGVKTDVDLEEDEA